MKINKTTRAVHMKSSISTILQRPEAQVSEKLNSILNVFSEQALTDLIRQRMMEEGSSLFIEGATNLAEIFVGMIADLRRTSPVSNDVITHINSLDYLAKIKSETSDEGLSRKIDQYLKSLPGAPEVSVAAKKHHGLVSMYLNHAMRQLMVDLEDARAHEKHVRPAKEGDVVAEGPGFDVVVDKAGNHVRYPDGNTSVIVMHDVREGHFLMVERYNPIKGVYVLEFPRIKSSSLHTRDSALNSELRDLTGLPFRNLERIGQVYPESHILEGACEIYYGNFDLEENHQQMSKQVRSLKRITEDGLYLAAYEARVECGVTLAAMSVWHAFENVRKKRVNNSKRVRNKVEDEDED